MKSKNMLAVVLRIGAIIVAINIIEKIPLNFGTFYIEGHLNWYMLIGFVILPNLIMLFVAALMWINPNIFLRHISEEETIKLEYDFEEIASMLIAIAGLYIIAFSLSDLIYHITSIKVAKSIMGTDFRFMPDQVGSIAATIAELLIGLSLIYGRNILLMLVQQFKKEFKSSL